MHFSLDKDYSLYYHKFPHHYLHKKKRSNLLKPKPFLVQILILILFITKLVYAQEWQSVTSNLPINKIKYLKVDDFNHNIIFISSERELYKTIDGGKNWKNIYKLSDEDNSIINFYFDPIISDSLYIITQKKLFKNNRNTWHEIFTFSEESNETINCMAINPFNKTHIFLGTTHGIYTKSTAVNSWANLPSLAKNSNITALAFHPNIKDLLFLATENKIYKTFLATTDTIKIYLPTSNISEKDIDSKEISNKFAFFISEDNFIFLLHNQRIFKSHDYGASWEHIKNIYSKTKYIDSATTPFIADNNTVYYINQNKTSFQKIIANNLLSDISAISIHDNKQNIIYVATNKGLYAYNLSLSPPNFENHLNENNSIEISANKINRLFSNEPNILQLHKAAINYAHVGNEKTKQWHRNSRLRALMPKVSIDLDQSIGKNIDLDRGSTSTDDVYIIGPDNKDVNLGMSLEWDFSDIIWNSNQTSIDYREKYTIEMRENILNELNSLFFERKKLKIKTTFNSNITQDELTDLILKIEELTARIDALTGGFMSQTIKTNQS